MKPITARVAEATRFLQTHLGQSGVDLAPATGLITGTGLSGVTGQLEDGPTLPYEAIPHFPVSTVVSHAGRLAAGILAGRPMIVMQGRFHLYEGYTPEEVTFPVRVMRALGVRHLILTNAAGGINTAFAQGDLMIVRDHLNLTGESPLIGPNDDRWGVRFPDMTAAYDDALIQAARDAAKAIGIDLKSGVYAGLKGPALETPAEIRFLKTIGADAVGFSSVMESIAAVHAGMRVLGISTITNINDPEHPRPAVLEEIVAVANRTAPVLNRLVGAVVRRIHEGEPA